MTNSAESFLILISSSLKRSFIHLYLQN